MYCRQKKKNPTKNPHHEQGLEEKDKPSFIFQAKLARGPSVVYPCLLDCMCIESPGTEESPVSNYTIIIYLAELSTESLELKRHYFLLAAEMMKDVNIKIQL